MTWTIIVKGAVSLPALKTFLRLGLPGGLNMAADGIAFDITTAFAGFLGTYHPLLLPYRVSCQMAYGGCICRSVFATGLAFQYGDPESLQGADDSNINK